MTAVCEVTLTGEVITGYWNKRAKSYYNGVVGELSDDRRDVWERVIDRETSELFAKAIAEDRTPRVLDLGCGPGFFSVLFANRGCKVDAVDASCNMIERARVNVSEFASPESVTFHCLDVASLPFEDAPFDLAISRNLTWLMREPESAYAEWMRVLRPGGKLLVFDANWYRYLVDPAINAARLADQVGNSLDGWEIEAQATSEEEKRCEAMAAQLPLTPVLRPAWDVRTLESLGASSVYADESVWEELWTENEKSYYGSSPMFMVKAVK